MQDTLTQSDVQIIIQALKYRIDNLYRVSEAYRRRNDFRGQWGCIQERRKVQDTLDTVIVNFQQS